MFARGGSRAGSADVATWIHRWEIMEANQKSNASHEVSEPFHGGHRGGSAVSVSLPFSDDRSLPWSNFGHNDSLVIV